MLVNNPKRYGTACEGIMFDENNWFLTEANVTQQSEGRKLCFQQALFLTSRHYAVGVSKIIPYSYINICFKFYHTLYINSTFKTNEKNIKYDSIFGNVSRETFFLCFT